jgi:hypothetical protein
MPKINQPVHDAARARGIAWDLEQARIQRARDAKAAADRAATDAAALAQSVELPNFAEQVRRQRLGVVIAPATPPAGRAAAAHVARIHAVTDARSEWRAISAQASELQGIVNGIAEKRGIRL